MSFPNKNLQVKTHGSNGVRNSHWAHYISNNSVVKICLEPYRFYLTDPSETTYLSASDDLWDPEKFTSPEKFIVPWTPIVMYLGRTERSYKFLAGDKIGYWFDDTLIELHPIKQPFNTTDFSF